MEIPIPNAEESALISRVRNGETDAFKLLYDVNVDLLYRFLKQFRKSDSDVQELVQRSFIKAYEGLTRFSGRSKFKTWLFQIALNELRSDARRNSIIPFVVSDDIDESVSEEGGNILEWNSTLKTLFDELDETKRAVFILYEVEGYSHMEIAAMLDIGESTSRTILTRTKH
ncbi:MAG: RNA polymerase sigma factor [Ignavibacteriales bacterium]|nr:RNA polymerase sigma factor [Ignavibacteriales bacterium]